jgi:hypothetical protein
MTDEHVAGCGDRWAYMAGWKAALERKTLDFAIRGQKGGEKQHSFRCGYFAATQDDADA